MHVSLVRSCGSCHLVLLWFDHKHPPLLNVYLQGFLIDCCTFMWVRAYDNSIGMYTFPHNNLQFHVHSDITMSNLRYLIAVIM